MKEFLYEFLEFYWSFLKSNPNAEDETVIKSFMDLQAKEKEGKEDICKCCGLRTVSQREYMRNAHKMFWFGFN